MTDKKAHIPRGLLTRPGTQILLFIFTVIYVVSPVDVVPDIAPVIGWIDDLVVLLAQITSFMLYLKQKRKEARGEESTNQEGK